MNIRKDSIIGVISSSDDFRSANLISCEKPIILRELRTADTAGCILWPFLARTMLKRFWKEKWTLRISMLSLFQFKIVESASSEMFKVKFANLKFHELYTLCKKSYWQGKKTSNLAQLAQRANWSVELSVEGRFRRHRPYDSLPSGCLQHSAYPSIRGAGICSPQSTLWNSERTINGAFLLSPP